MLPVALFTVTTLLSAALLFAVEPMVAKLLLPPFGGSPMVWNTSVLFFQIVLLAGYAYAHWAPRLVGRAHPPLHIALACLPLLVLPVTLPAWSQPPAGAPVALWLLVVLVVMVGLPFGVLAATGPLLQRWYAGMDVPRAHDPYFLYAASNAGSLMALLGYPLVVEPTLGLGAQSDTWGVVYVAFAVALAACALLTRRLRRRPSPVTEAAAAAITDKPTVEDAPERITGRRRARWVLVAALPSSLNLGVTTHITTDVAPVPLLWVVPLSLYLATYIAAFASTRRRAPAWAVDLAAVLALPALIVATVPVGELVSIGIALLFLTVTAYAAHALLAADRPDPRRLTEFFLLTSAGGALGALFNGLLAPAVFDRVAEYSLVAAAVALLPLAVTGRSRPVRRSRWPAPYAAGAAVLALALVFAPGRDALLHERTFFGAYSITDSDGRRLLRHGTTTHGAQLLDPAQRHRPLLYYDTAGPAGDVFRAAGRTPRVGVVGLGAGGLAAYGRAGQHFDFYEIDPSIADLARERFTYLGDCRCTTAVTIGDGRLSLARATDRRYGLIVLDAYSSDAVPTHLITREAMDVFASRLAPGGLMVFHVSNRVFDLAPMAGATARAAGLHAVTATAPSDPSPYGSSSSWVAVAREPADLEPLKRGKYAWTRTAGGGPVWTDSYSSVWQVIKRP